jgi:septal ring factor EnvC (AmiA/AmiB activator)
MPEHSGCYYSENVKTARNALLQQVAVLESEMEDTRAQIAQKQAFLFEQEQQRRRLDSQLNSLSPIDQLPAEIKTEIFYSAL